jgi:hypothetical protein
MMILITVVGLALNLLALMPAYSAGIFFTANDVKAIALHHNAKSTYLDVKTQKELLTFLNKAEVLKAVDPSEITNHSFSKMEKMVLHRFNHPKIELVPVGFLGDKMVLHVVGLNEVSFIVKDAPQELAHLISNSYDS